MSGDGDEFTPLEPGGHTLPMMPGPDNPRAPEAHTHGRPMVRFRHLPPAEQLRRIVETEIRYVAQRHRRLLTADALILRKKWSPDRLADVLAAMNDPVTVANLRGLGILPDDVESYDDATEGTTTPSHRQLEALDAILGRVDFGDRRSPAEILDELGISLRTWNGWLADPVFAGYIRDRTHNLVGDNSHEVDITLVRRAIAGDVPAIKLVLELQGRIKRTGDTVDVNAILARVVEIIDVEIADRETKLRIASQLQALSDAAGRGGLPRVPAVVGEITGVADELAVGR